MASNYTVARAFSYGHCEGILGQECRNPFHGYTQRNLADSYLAGYIKGAQYRAENNITLTLPVDRGSHA